MEIRYPIHEHNLPASRLKSRKSFMRNESLDPIAARIYRLDIGREWDQTPTNTALQDPTEELPQGRNLERKDWVTLNRDRAKVGRTGRNLHKWGLIPSSECPCGHPTQTMEHILRQCDLGPKITDRDLLEGNDLALNWAKTWRDKI